MTAPSRSQPDQPANFDALVALAQREHAAGHLAEAAAAYRQILRLRPDVAEVYNNLGNVLLQQGRLDEAQAQYEQALARNPALFSSHNELGCVFQQQGRFERALASFQRAVAINPANVEAGNNLGNALHERGRLDEAAGQYRRVLTLQPDFFQAIYNLGNVFRDQQRLDQAVACYLRVLALHPRHVGAHNNLGSVLFRQGQLDEAAARFAQALALKPDLAEAHNNLAIVRREQGRFDEAVASYRQALALRPDYPDAEMGLGACHLTQGDYERGWAAYAARLRKPGFLATHNLPFWKGEPLAGRSVLLLAEQGFGDTFHFIRYARLLKQRGARVVIAVPAALGRLLAAQPDGDEIFLLGSGQPLPRCDYCLPMLQAPALFHTDAASIPADVPYLVAAAELVAKWRAELAAIDGFKIGIVWQGSTEFSSDRWRSIPLAEFAPLAALPGVRLVSLQKGAGTEQIAAVEFPIVDWSDRLDVETGPFLDTAAVIAALDLVIAPDTAVGHLAGALGARVWLALQRGPNWRWLLNRDDSPWYPTMRLFRQTELGQWSDVMRRMAAAVEILRSETQ